LPGTRYHLLRNGVRWASSSRRRARVSILGLSALLRERKRNPFLESAWVGYPKETKNFQAARAMARLIARLSSTTSDVIYSKNAKDVQPGENRG
jgi:hypothetical protein